MKHRYWYAALLTAGASVVVAGPAIAGAPYSCTTSASSGVCPSSGAGYNYAGFSDFNNVMNYGSPYVDANEWGPVSGQTQTLAANSPGDWQVREYIPAASNTGHAVTTYPNAGMELNNPPMTSFGDITSAFADTIPSGSGDVGWQGYDNWYNNWADEVMIQTQWVNTGPCDYAAVAQFGGSNGVPVQTWGLCNFGAAPGAGGGGEKVWKLAPSGTQPGGNATLNETSGTVDVTAMTDWLVTHGYMASSTPAATTITALSAGFEICNTASTGSVWTYTNLTFVNNTGTSPSPTPTSTSPSPSPTTPTPTPTTPTPTPTATSPSPTPTGTSLLVGDSAVEGLTDWSNQGQAEAFSYVAAKSGTSQTFSFYVDPSSTATAGALGEYTDSGYNSPGALLKQAAFTPHSGWNTITFTGVGEVAGREYWLAELGTAGQLVLRDQGTGTKDEESAQTNLTSLPATWSDGTAWDSGHMSAYISG